MRKKLKILTGALLVGAGFLTLQQTACLSSFGGDPSDGSGDALRRMRSSAMYQNGEFENIPVVPRLASGRNLEMLQRQFFGTEERVPPAPLPVVHPDASAFATPPAPGLRAVWFGHASVLVEIDGVRIFTDPVFEARVSPFTDVGPERFFPPPVAREQLPRIDAVVISHDHYDHLEMATARELARRGTRYFVPLGVGAHLRAWGVPEAQITELDWWESRKLGAVEIVCTPAVHYSGRGLLKKNPTLWASWSVIGPAHRFFHSGDTGYSEHFAKIGERFGPFDLTSIKTGAYDVTWETIHMNPERAVDAHQALRGKHMLPVHWGTFNLALHRWDEPIRRVRAAATRAQVDLWAPRPGEMIDSDQPFETREWWVL